MGGAGHEVRDLPQGPDVGGVVPLLHLFLDQAFQLLSERLKQAPRCWYPQCVSWERLRTPLEGAHPIPWVSEARATHGILRPQRTLGIPLGPQESPKTAVWEAKKCPVASNPDSRSSLGLSDTQEVPPTSNPATPAIRHGRASL